MQNLAVQSEALTSFPLDCQTKKMTTANTTIATWYERIEIIPTFCQLGKNNIIFAGPHNLSN